MTDKKERTVSYRRADWLIDHPESINLTSCIKQAAAKLKSVDERTVGRSNGQLIRLASLKGRLEGLLMHLTVETPGESASVVPKVDAVAEETEVSTTSPPDGTEFMDGDAFLYTKGNDVCLCTTGVQDGAIRDFLIRFFKKAKIRQDASHFDLIKVANISKVKLLHSEGVDEVELRSTLYDATAHYLKRKSHPQGLLGHVSKHVKALLGKENDANHDALKVTLTLKTDKRRTGLALGEKRLKDIGIDMLKNADKDDDFTIITKRGQRIGPDEIYMRSTVEIDAIGKSVDRNEAWKEVLNYYSILQSIGALEE